jgi:hypothetical protein
MINWFEVALMKKRYENFCKKETEDLAEEDIVICNLDRGRLIYLLNQFRPHPFDPEDRETWPPFNEELIINYKGGTRDLAVITCCVGKQFEIKSFGMNVGRFLGSIKSWQPLPPVGKEGK